MAYFLHGLIEQKHIILSSLGGFILMILRKLSIMGQWMDFTTWLLGVILSLGILHKLWLDIKLKKRELKDD